MLMRLNWFVGPYTKTNHWDGSAELSSFTRPSTCWLFLWRRRAWLTFLIWSLPIGCVFGSRYIIQSISNRSQYHLSSCINMTGSTGCIINEQIVKIYNQTNLMLWQFLFSIVTSVQLTRKVIIKYKPWQLWGQMDHSFRLYEAAFSFAIKLLL